jgi:hypothetical protein
LQVIESIEYNLDQIKRAIRIGTDDPDPSGFRAAIPYAKYLYELLRIASINEERNGRRCK